MSKTIALEAAVPFIPAMGIELLGSEADSLGLGTGFDVAGCGGASEIIDIAVCGSNDALGLVARTGFAGDDADLLIGCAGVDTACTTVLPLTGSNVLMAWVDQGGTDMLGHSDAMPSTALPYDMSVALMLHRIDIVASRVAVHLAAQTGCAR